MRWGDFRATEPKSRRFAERGDPIDRHYIESFLEEHAADVRGVALEVASDEYIRRFGGTAVERAEVVSILPGPGVTIVGDLRKRATLPPQHFDVIVLTQTLQFIYEVHEAMDTIAQSLKPGGVLLLTVPGISQISRSDQERTGDYWRFTPASVQRLLDDHFRGGSVSVRSFGNVLSAIAFLHNVARQELTPEEIDVQDAQYPMIVAGRAVNA